MRKLSLGVGDDLIDGAGGDDTILGAAGHDTVFAFDGNDSIQGGEGDDVLSGESGDDALLGETGDDVLMGGENDDYLDGGEGRDFLNGQRGNDALVGGAGDDALEGESGQDLLVGGDGIDIANGGFGDDVIYGDAYTGSLDNVEVTNSSNFSSLTNLFTPTETSTTNNNDSSSSNNNNDSSSSNENNVVLAQDPIRLEAENFAWSGDEYISTRSFASGGEVVKSDSDGKSITGTNYFTGVAGVYDIVIGYHDIEDTGTVSVSLDNNQIDSWNLTNDLSGATTAEAASFRTRVIQDVDVSYFDTIEITAERDGEDKVYLDYVEFIPLIRAILPQILVVVHNSSSSNSNTNNVVLGQDPIRVEAEDLSWDGKTKDENESFASGGTLVKNDDKGGDISGTTTFSGDAGTYNIVIAYHDVKDDGAMTFKVDGSTLESWTLNQDSGDKEC